MPQETSAPPSVEDEGVITFDHVDGQDTRNIFTISADGRLTMGEHLSPDEASRKVFDTLAANFPKFVDGLVGQVSVEKAENARLREAARTALLSLEGGDQEAAMSILRSICA